MRSYSHRRRKATKTLGHIVVFEIACLPCVHGPFNLLCAGAQEYQVGTEPGAQKVGKRSAEATVCTHIQSTQGSPTDGDHEIPLSEPKTDCHSVVGHPKSDGILSTETFDALGVSPGILRAIKDMEFQHLTHIQLATIPPLLKGRDVLGAARTGETTTCID
jgi:hypothetical protein